MLGPKIPPGYMPMPKGCGRGAQPVFDDKVCIDTLICHYYCTDECQEYVDYDRKRMRISKEWKEERKKAKRMTSSGRKDLDLDFADRIEAKPKRKDLEI